MIYSAASLRRRGGYSKSNTKDNHPTFILFVPEDKDEVYFKDFAWQGGNVFKFVKLFALYQESINLKEFTDRALYRPANGHWIVWKHQGKTHTKKSTGQSVLCL
jgi:hypothetical protein